MFHNNELSGPELVKAVLQTDLFVQICAEAKYLGWRVFSKQVLSGFIKEQPHLSLLIHDFMDQLDYCRFDQNTINICLAIFIRCVMPLPLIGPEVCEQLRVDLLGTPESRKVIINDGSAYFEEYYQTLNYELCQFISKVCQNDDSCTRSILFLAWTIGAALARQESSELLQREISKLEGR